MVSSIRKRDARIVPFDVNKIAQAIFRAASSQGGKDYVLSLKIAAEVLERLNEQFEDTVPDVEQVQDLVEKTLIKSGHARTAKAYILYRHQRTKIREMNTRLMTTIRDLTFKDAKDNDLKRENANIDGDTAMGMMLRYGSESSKQFYEMYILNPKHSLAHKNGDIHIHDLDFLTLTTTCCQIDIKKLFKGGFGTGLSLFSIGGNSGFVFGPMLAVAAIGAFGLSGTSVFGLIALVMSVILLYQISHLSGMKKIEADNAKAAGEAEEVTNNWKEFSKLTLAIISRSVLFVGCNTFIPLYWIHNFGQSKAAGAAALTCFCTFGVISNFIGGYLRIIRLSYVILIPSIILFGLVDNLYAAFALLLPLGFSLYAPFSSMVVLGQKYLAKNIGFASGVTLGLATSMGGIVAPLLGWIADGYGLPRAIQSMTFVAAIGTVAAFLLVSLNRRTD